MTTEEFDIMIKDAFDSDPKFNLFDIKYDFTPAKISRKTDRFVKKLGNEMFCAPSKPAQCRRFRPRYLVAAIIGASILAGGVAAYNSDYIFTKGDEEMAYVSAESTVGDKTSIEEVYELTYKPEGYRQTQHEVYEVFANTVYEKDKCDISFSQNVVGSCDRLVNTENATIETIEINGDEAIYIDCSNEYGDVQILIWTYDGYEFWLTVGAKPNEREFSKEQVIEMAETIQIKN